MITKGALFGSSTTLPKIMMTKIIAHRGYSAKYPENTLTAFKAALDSKSDGIELDVHFTSDGQLIVHHDYYLGNPDASQSTVFKKDSAYIKSLKVGATEHIPTLQQVFTLIGDKMQYELELKGFTEEFLQKVIALANDFGLTNKIEFTSPITYNLSRLKQLRPSLKTGMFATPFPDWMDKELGQTLLINNAKLGGIKVLHCPLQMIDQDLITLAHAEKLLVHAADCNTPEAFQKAFTLGVDQLSTNRPELAVAFRRLFIAR